MADLGAHPASRLSFWPRCQVGVWHSSCIESPGIEQRALVAPAEEWTGTPAGGPDVTAARSGEAETSSSPPGYLTPLLAAVPIAGSRFTEDAEVQTSAWVEL